jgi:hypothetical protein
MTSRGKNVLIGSLVTVGVAIVLVIAASLGFRAWLNRPVALLDPIRLMSSDATGYAEWTLRLDDPGTDGFVKLLIQGLQEMPSDVEDSLPSFVGTWVEAARNDQTQTDIEKIFPLVAAWTLHPGQKRGDDLHLVGISVQGIGNQVAFADWIAGFFLGRSDRSTIHEYQDETIYQYNIGTNDFDLSFFAQNGTVFATSELAMAERAVELLGRDERRDQDRTELEHLFARTHDDDPFRAALTNQGDEGYRLWEAIGGEPVEIPREWQALEGISLTGGLAADGAFDAVMELVAPGAGWSDVHAKAVEVVSRQELERFSLEFTVRAAAVDDGLRLDVRIPNLVESLARLLERVRRNQRFGPAS